MDKNAGELTTFRLTKSRAFYTETEQLKFSSKVFSTKITANCLPKLTVDFNIATFLIQRKLRK